jgi:hypothetical protein
MGPVYDFSLHLPAETDLFSGATRIVPHPGDRFRKSGPVFLLAPGILFRRTWESGLLAALDR